MKIDLISDLHLDMHSSVGSPVTPTKLAPNEDSRVLVIAGDLGHNNEENVNFMVQCLEYYDKVLFVLGNHDWYAIPSFGWTDSLQRIEHMKRLVDCEKNIHLLDGEPINCYGYDIYGYNGWYDGQYGVEHFRMEQQKINALWSARMNDCRYVTCADEYDSMHTTEKGPEKKYDLVVTHVNPSTKKKHHNPIYRESPLTSFYCFDGLKDIETAKPTYWVFGHTHDPIDFRIGTTEFVCNPYGYPHQAGETKVRQLDLTTNKTNKGKKKNG